MRARFVLISQAMVLCCNSVAVAGEPSWVTFEDQTDTRLAADPTVALNNPDEKDYAWGDVDGDGDIDLVAVMKLSSTPGSGRRNALFMNEGGVLVDRTVEYAAASTVMLDGGGLSQGFLDLTNDRDVVLADVTGDTWLDIVTSTIAGEEFGKAISHPRVYVNLGNDGEGEWLGFLFDDEDRAPTVTAPRFTSVSTGDIDDDSDLDLYFTSKDLDAPSPDDQLWINDGQGYFTDDTAARLTSAMVDSPSSDAEFADMNGDGALDIVKVKAVTSAAVRIHYNDPLNEGVFATSEVVYSFSPEFIGIADLNNDTRLDIVITDDGSDRYLLNTGNGADGLANFAQSAILQGSQASAFGSHIVIADLNQDDWLDVAIGSVYFGSPSCSTSAKLYHNLGLQPDGFSLTIAQQGDAGIAQADLTGVHDFAVFDINGDTWLDIVIGRCFGTRVYLNLPPPEACLVSGDMNDDGLLDGRDIPIFTDCFFNAGVVCACADLDPNEVLDHKDVLIFVVQLLTGP